MPECVSPRCGRTADNDWGCCAFCGTPLWGQPRPEEDYCDHEFVLEGPYCIRCGYDPEVGGRSERRDYLIAGVAMVVLGILVAGWAMFSLSSPGSANAPANSRGGRSMGTAVVVGLVFFGLGLSRVFKALRIGD